MFDISLTPETTRVVLILLYLLGVGTRIVWPYVVTYLTEPQNFDLEKTKGQVVAAVVGFVGILLGSGVDPEFFEALGVLSFAGAFIAGYGAAAFGRQGQKTVGLRGK